MTQEASSHKEELEAAPLVREPRENRFAALTAGLLARKGEAEPAMERFSHARIDAGSAREMAPGERHVLERKGASESPAAHIDPIGDPEASEEWRRVRPVREGNGAGAAFAARPPQPDKGAAKEFAENCPRERIAKSAKRAAVTFRMSVHDFLRLKLASAELESSSQDIIIEALESWLDQKGVERLDNCRCLAEAARACGEKAVEE